MRFPFAAAVALLMLPSDAFANEAATTPLEWWQIATGILAVPAAFLGLVYSYFQIQKTRLETRKIAIEVSKTERELGLERLGPALTATGQYRGRLIFVYLLLASGSIVGYTFVFSGTGLLPITVEDTVKVYALMLPVLAAQLTIPLVWTRYRYLVLTGGTALLWAIAAPLVAVAIFGVAVLGMTFSSLPLSIDFFIYSVALSITLLNVATIQIVARMIAVEPEPSSIE